VSAEVVAKLRAGHIKIADKLGALYTMHPFRLDNPMDSSYAGDQLLVAFAADVAFSAPLKHNKAVWICYADQEQVEPLVFLDGPYGVFYIADKQPYQPMQAVRTNKRLNFGRGEYIQGGGEITQGVVNYATNIPCFMQFAREDIQRPNTSLGQTMGRAVTHWTTFIPMEQGTLLQDDIATDELGIQYTVDAPDYTNMGYVCHLRLATQ
jgi:hypothetical protein